MRHWWPFWLVAGVMALLQVPYVVAVTDGYWRRLGVG